MFLIAISSLWVFALPQATMLAERDSRRAENIINLRCAFELEQNNYEYPSALLWWCLSHLRNHQSWSWHCSQLCLSAPSPISPSPLITHISSTPVHLMTFLASSLLKQPQSHCLYLAINILQQRAKQATIPQPCPPECNNCIPRALCIPLMLCSNVAAPSIPTTVSQSLAHTSNPIKPDGLVA